MKKIVRLTEGKLRKMIAEAVNTILESEMPILHGEGNGEVYRDDAFVTDWRDNPNDDPNKVKAPYNSYVWNKKFSKHYPTPESFWNPKDTRAYKYTRDLDKIHREEDNLKKSEDLKTQRALDAADSRPLHRKGSLNRAMDENKIPNPMGRTEDRVNPYPEYAQDFEDEEPMSPIPNKQRLHTLDRTTDAFGDWQKGDHAYYDDGEVYPSAEWSDTNMYGKPAHYSQWAKDADEELEKMQNQRFKDSLDKQWQNTKDIEKYTKQADSRPLHRKGSLNRVGMDENVIGKIVSESIRETIKEEIDTGQVPSASEKHSTSPSVPEIRKKIRLLRNKISDYEEEGKDTSDLTKQIEKLKKEAGFCESTNRMQNIVSKSIKKVLNEK